MLQVIGSVWALLLGVMLIMMGLSIQTTLIGVRGAIESFASYELSIAIAAFFCGYLWGTRIAPRLIQRVGYVRVFAALGSLVSAGLIAFELFVNPFAWILIRFCIGFCMSGVFVTAESWLNNVAVNTTRGQLLSAYMIAQTMGVALAQWVLTLGDAAQATLFITTSILVSLSFTPILLSATPMPSAAIIQPMGLFKLHKNPPLAR